MERGDALAASVPHSDLPRCSGLKIAKLSQGTFVGFSRANCAPNCSTPYLGRVFAISPTTSNLADSSIRLLSIWMSKEKHQIGWCQHFRISHEDFRILSIAYLTPVPKSVAP